MATNKTVVATVDPYDFIKQVEDPTKRKDSEELIAMMQKVTRKPPKMWGPSIIGFGTYHYKYESGREGDMCMTGFSPRRPSLVLYIGGILQDKELMGKLGKYKMGKGCLYIKRLDDIDRKVLKQLVVNSVAEMRKRYVCD